MEQWQHKCTYRICILVMMTFCDVRYRGSLLSMYYIHIHPMDHRRRTTFCIQEEFQIAPASFNSCGSCFFFDCRSSLPPMCCWLMKMFGTVLRVILIIWMICQVRSVIQPHSKSFCFFLAFLFCRPSLSFMPLSFHTHTHNTQTLTQTLSPKLFLELCYQLC